MRRIFGGKQDGHDANLVKRELIMDERVLVISTFELNKVASLTYNELVCDDIFEMIELILAQPLRHTPLALSKTLVVMLHCLIYGSEKCVNSGYGIAKFVESLRDYNTVLIAQQRQGLGGAISRIKGGGVDKGEPVRESAKKICALLSNIKELQRIRHESASKDSLVPVGSNKVGFITDEVRLLILKKRIEKQNQVNLKSNLAKAEGGFGGGYNAADGKSVVGAAHGVEEMMKMAKQRKKKFSDEGSAQVGETDDERILRELMEEANAVKKAQERALKEAELERQAQKAANAKELDLLSFSGGGVVTAPSPAPTAAADWDLLGGGGAATNPTRAATADLLGGMDSFGASSTPVAQTQATLLDGLLSFAIGQPFSSVPPTVPQPVSATAPAPTHDPFGGVVLGPDSSSGVPIDTSIPSISASTDTFNAANNASISRDIEVGTRGMESMILSEFLSAQQQPPSTMASSDDRFAALDALADSACSSSKAASSEPQNADHCIMGISLPPPTLDHPLQATNRQYTSEPTTIGAGTRQIAATFGDAGDRHEDNPWVMGGAAGTGLSDPIAPPPGSAPPPPPPP